MLASATENGGRGVGCLKAAMELPGQHYCSVKKIFTCMLLAELETKGINEMGLRQNIHASYCEWDKCRLLCILSRGDHGGSPTQVQTPQSAAPCLHHHNYFY